MCKWKLASEVRTASIVSHLLVLGTIMVSLASSAFSGISNGQVFQIVNFMQLYMLLILIRAELPLKIVEYILANYLLNSNFGNSGFGSIPILNDFLSIYQFDHSDEALERLSIESLSTFYNLFMHLVILMLVVSIHLIFWLIKAECPVRNNNSRLVRL